MPVYTFIQFATPALTVYESDRSVIIPITRSRIGGGTPAAEVHPAAGGTAKKGKDYLYDPTNPPKVTWDSDTALTGKAEISIQQNNQTQGDRTLSLHLTKLVNCRKGNLSECIVTIKDGVNPNSSGYTYNVSASSINDFIAKGKTEGFNASDTVLFSSPIASTEFHASTIVAGVQELQVSVTQLSLKADTPITYTYPNSFKEQSIAWTLYENARLINAGGDNVPGEGQTHYDAADFQSDGAEIGKTYYYLETNQATGEQVRSPELTLVE